MQAAITGGTIGGITIDIAAVKAQPKLELGNIKRPPQLAASFMCALCVPKIRFGVDAGNGRGKLAP